MAIGQQLSRGSDDGWCAGQSASDKGGFFGLATPIVRPVSVTFATVTKTTTTTSTTTALTTDLDAVRARVNVIVTALLNLGLISAT